MKNYMYNKIEERAKEISKNYWDSYNILEEFEYFTRDELILITGMYGNRLEVLNLACSYRYCLDIEQICIDIMNELELII